MTCRHGPNDPNCGSHPDSVAARMSEYETERRTKAELEQTIRGLRDQISLSPDAKNYAIEDVEQVGSHLVMKVRYPNCAKCAYEGIKVMVFAEVTLKQAIKWRRIDPHFRKLGAAPTPTEAPGPSLGSQERLRVGRTPWTT